MPRIESIHVAPTSTQRADPGRFSTTLRNAAAGLARGVAATVDLAAPYVPGGTVLSAAIRSAVPRPAAAIADGLGAGETSPSATAAAGAAGSDGDVLQATRALQQESQTFNLQYLQLQENMQRESREFTALSNVMKVKHDSAKAAIQNIH